MQRQARTAALISEAYIYEIEDDKSVSAGLGSGERRIRYSGTSRANPGGLSPPGSATAKLGTHRCLRRVEQATYG